MLRDLVVMLADGGDAISDLATLRDQPDLFGKVASTPTAWRIIGQVAADPRGIAALWSALAGSSRARPPGEPARLFDGRRQLIY